MKEIETETVKGKAAESPRDVEDHETKADKEEPPQKAEEALDWEKRYKYLLADFENYRRRVEKEREVAVRSSVGRIMLRIIDLHDGIERTLSALPTEAKAVKEGLELLLKNLDTLLQDEKLVALAKAGQPFSPEVHEAVGSVECGEGKVDGSIAHVVQQGYSSPSGMLRPAKVIVYGTSRTTEAPAQKTE